MRKVFALLVVMTTCLTLQAQMVSIHRSGARVLDLIQQLQQEYGYSFSMPSDVVDVEKVIESVEMNNWPIEDALKLIFKGQNVSFVVSDKTIIVKSSTPAAQQPQPQATPEPQPKLPVVEQKQATTSAKQQENVYPTIVEGRVVDETGEPLIGAGIHPLGGDSATITDLDGKFKITLKSSNRKVLFSYIGCQEQTIDIGTKSKISVTLIADKTSLDEVVVIGYGQQKRSDLTGSVATVKMDDIESTLSTSVDNALQGRIAGVDIMSSGGDPGSASSIRIRGSRSVNASNEPLIVVDGVMDAVQDISDIDPGAIESISVLKDASSTAIYGSRGANGVIMITTKNAKSSKPSVNVNIKSGVSFASRLLDIMSAEQFVQYRNDQYTTSRIISGSSDISEPYSIDQFPNTTDWQKEIIRVTPTYSASVSVSEKLGKGTNFFGTLSATDERGIIKETSHRRIYGNFKFFRSFSDYLDVTFTTTTNVRWRDQNKVVISGSDQVNGAIYLTPLMGNLDNFNPLVDSGYYINTPTARLNYTDKLENSYSVNNALQFVFKLPKNVKIKENLSSYWIQIHRYRFEPSYMPANVSGTEGAYGYRNEWNCSNLASETTLSWAGNIKKKHNFDVLAGFTASRKVYEDLTISGKGLTSDEVKWNALGTILSKDRYSSSASNMKFVKLSALARFNYNFKNKYYLTLTGRADGSSNFAENNKWGFFPSGAFKWNVKNERFLKRAHWISGLQLRLSAGISGNDAINAYQSQQAYGSTTGGYLFDGSQEVAFYPSRIGDPDLTWEKTTMYNVALEGGFLKNRIKYGLELYHSRTRDLLIALKTMRSTGYSSRMTNIGATSNKGVEFSLETVNIEKKNFGWTTSFTISHNDQMVEDIGGESYVSLISDKEGYMIYGYKKGYPLNSMWGFQYAGVWHSADEFERNEITHSYASFRNSYNKTNCMGHSKFVDVNGDGTLDEQDRIFLGQADPIVQGGLQNSFTIGKGLRLKLFLSYSIGGKIFNYSELFMAGSTQSNQYTYMANCWHPTKRPDSDLPRAGDNYRLLSSSFQIHDASYLRIKSLSIDYTFYLKKGASKTNKSITLGLSGENLFVWTGYNGYDPDVSASGSSTNLRRVDMNAQPRPTTYMLSLKLNL